MAKTLKNKPVKKAKDVKTQNPIPAKAAIEAGNVNVTLSKSDLALFTNLMSICSQTFENLAQQAKSVNDGKAEEILSARARLSTQLAYLLLSHHQMPEPESREVH
jgi:hypothetical protein